MSAITNVVTNDALPRNPLPVNESTEPLLIENETGDVLNSTSNKPKQNRIATPNTIKQMIVLIA